MDCVVVRAGNEETTIVRDLHIVRVHTDVKRADDFVGCSINDADRFTGPVGDEQTLAIWSQRYGSWIDLHRNARQDGTSIRVEDDNVTWTVACAAVCRVEQVTARQIGR